MNISRILQGSQGKLRNGYWIGIFFFMLFPLVATLIFLSASFNFEITIWHQLTIIVIVTVICQWIRKESLLKITGKFNNQWYSDLLAGSIIGTGLMILPALLLIIRVQ